MRKVFGIIVVAFFIAVFSSCIFFTSESEFYLYNETSHALSVSWINDEDETETSVIAINENALLKKSVMGETNDIKPTFVFKSLQATANISGLDEIVYNQNPIDNGVWQRISGNKNRYYIYTLSLTDSDLTLP